MSEPTKTDPEKTRRKRSFGSFLLFLVVLVVILLIVGKDTINKPKELTQDQFEWELHNGNVVNLEFVGSEQGTNLVEGSYKKAREREPVKFKARYASLEDKERLFQTLNAIPDYQEIAPQSLVQGIEQGWFDPIAARSLISWKQELEDQSGAEERAEPLPPRETWDERLLVTVVAKAEAPGATRSGHVYFNVQLDHTGDPAGLFAAIEKAGVTIEQFNFDLTEKAGTQWRKDGSFLLTFLIYYGPWILIFVVFMIFMRQMRSQGGAGGVMSFGRSRAQLYSKENHIRVTFDDVAGAEEAKTEVREIVEFLKNPTRFTRIGGRIPRGVLLVGPPGCGKTLLAKAIAGEAEVPFFSISGSDFVEMFVGVGASRVRDLFKQARDNSPCIIFLDEIDAVGRRRGSGMGGGHDEREQTLNAILVEMDGFGTDDGIIVVAATNRPDVLDPALLRPGRFDREVVIDLPDLQGREEILNVHLKRVKSGSDVVPRTLARSTPGYSGADLAAIVNEAAIMAVLDKRDEISMEDLEESRDKVRFGRQKHSRKIEEQDRKITACHEAGHAVVASVLPETDRPHKVTIVPRGRALGSTMMLPEKESYHMQREKLLAQLAMLFGGRVAEEEFCGDISAGAADDIKRATDLARAMVTELGMSDKIGPINYAERQGSDFLGTELMRSKLHSEETAREIDEEIRILLCNAYDKAREVVRSNCTAIAELTTALLDYETVTGKEVVRILEGETAANLRPKEETAEAPTAASPPVTEGKRPEKTGEPEEGPEDGGRAGELPGLSPA